MPTSQCATNHFDVQSGNTCPRCGKLVLRTATGREIDAPETPMSILPGGVFVAGGTSEQHGIMRKRGEFAQQYCLLKGWNIDKLTGPQLLEIRSMPGWKEPI